MPLLASVWKRPRDPFVRRSPGHTMSATSSQTRRRTAAKTPRTKPPPSAAEGAPFFFESPAALRAWFARHHERATELWLGYRKRHTGKPSVTWPESVDEALCVGWIDGVRKSIDASTCKIRFTPRKPGSIWSAVNVERAKMLEAEGRMRAAGRVAFAKRLEARTSVYAYEQRRSAELAPEERALLEANAAACAYFDSRPPWYRRTAIHWVVSAKKPETRRRRLDVLVESSRRAMPIPPLTPRRRIETLDATKPSRARR
jgi:uncharacterized protein YdeI (YjbR/CyaY-like superfamily)